jgi:hypothetical protein
MNLIELLLEPIGHLVELAASPSTVLRLRRPLSGRQRPLLVCGVASQSQRAQARGLFTHRIQIGLIFGHSLLAFRCLLVLLKLCFGATMRLIRRCAQCRNSFGKPLWKDRCPTSLIEERRTATFTGQIVCAYF